MYSSPYGYRLSTHTRTEIDREIVDGKNVYRIIKFQGYQRKDSTKKEHTYYNHDAAEA